MNNPEHNGPKLEDFADISNEIDKEFIDQIVTRSSEMKKDKEEFNYEKFAQLYSTYDILRRDLDGSESQDIRDYYSKKYYDNTKCNTIEEFANYLEEIDKNSDD